jgi:hypothetical protein
VITVIMTPPTTAYLIASTAHRVSAIPATAPLNQTLMPLIVVCGLLSTAFVAIGRLGTRLQRVNDHYHPGLHNQHQPDTRERALRWSRISCYSAATLLLLITLILAADTYFIPQ